MNLLSDYLERVEFDSYEDFRDNFHINIPEDFNFGFDVIDKYARVAPEKKCLVWCNDEGEERIFTYAEMKTLTDKTANYFRSLGIKKGDTVMLILQRHYEFWISIIALHKLGAVVVPATHLLTKKDIVYRVTAADIKMVVCTGKSEVFEHVEAAEPECPTLKIKILTGKNKRDGWLSFDEGVSAASDQFDRGADKTVRHDPMLMYFTSGTTGYPKMVLHTFDYPLGHITTAKYWQDVQDDKLHLTVADTGWGKAVWGKLYGQMIAGAVVFVYDYASKFHPTDLLEKIQQYRITTFCAPPTIYRFFIKNDISHYDLSSLEHCSIAGEPLNPEVYNQFLAATGQKLYEGFGQTESSVSLATFKWDEPRPGSMGKPCAGYHAVLLNDDLTECEPGQTGQIAFKTDGGRPQGVFREYYRDQERTDSVLHDGYYFTGDLAWCDEDGFFWYVGRADDVIKSSGYRIGPFEVESALLEHPAVFETAITAVPDEIRGQVVKATIKLAKGYEPSEALIKELQNHVKQSTAPYKYPRIIEFVDELPKTISGKIRRVQIRQEDQAKKQS